MRLHFRLTESEGLGIRFGRDQRFDAGQIERVRRIFAQYLENFFKRHPVPVRPLGVERVENVRHRQDAGKAGKLLRTPAAPVAGSVQLFVVGGGILAEPLESGNSFQNFERVVRMVLDERSILRWSASPGFSRIEFGTLNFPMSCSSAARRSIFRLLAAHAKTIGRFPRRRPRRRWNGDR